MSFHALEIRNCIIQKEGSASCHLELLKFNALKNWFLVFTNRQALQPHLFHRKTGSANASCIFQDTSQL